MICRHHHLSQGAVLWRPGRGLGGQERGSPGGAEKFAGNCDPEGRDAASPESPKPGGGEARLNSKAHKWTMREEEKMREGQRPPG